MFSLLFLWIIQVIINRGVTFCCRSLLLESTTNDTDLFYCESGGWHGSSADLVIVISVTGSTTSHRREDVSVVDWHGLFTGRRRRRQSASGVDFTCRHVSSTTSHQRRHSGLSTASHTGRKHAQMEWTWLRHTASNQPTFPGLLRRQCSHADRYITLHYI